MAMTNGLFTANARFRRGIFNGSNYWLEVDVRTNGGGSYANLNPLQAVTPSPYAIFATRRANLSGTISSANLSGAYGGAVTFNNGGNNFSGFVQRQWVKRDERERRHARRPRREINFAKTTATATPSRV